MSHLTPLSYIALAAVLIAAGVPLVIKNLKLRRVPVRIRKDEYQLRRID
jgi:hypothetical protein